MTSEEKAKRYNEAFKVARNIWRFSSNNLEIMRMEEIFPELRKDKEIMDYLITYFTNIDDCASSLKGKDIVAWVKRQGEHANFRNKIQIGDKVTRNEAGELVNISQLNRIAKPRVAKGSCAMKRSEQKPTWSEKDENGLGDALWCCEQAASIAKDENEMGNVWYAKQWLKSLKQRIK